MIYLDCKGCGKPNPMARYGDERICRDCYELLLRCITTRVLVESATNNQTTPLSDVMLRMRGGG
ncbi:MAG: hypothetical protein GY769_07820 [bacterium]|nr:hypothetical protein [bacterium]